MSIFPKQVITSLTILMSVPLVLQNCMSPLPEPDLPLLPENVAYVSNENAGISVIDLLNFEIIRQIPVTGSGPRGLAITTDGQFLLAANKETADVSVIDTRKGLEVRRIEIGRNPEFIKLHPDGLLAFTSHEPASIGGPPSRRTKEQIEAILLGPPSRIVAIDTEQWEVTKTFTGGVETEGVAFSLDGERMLVTNEAEDTVTVYDVEKGELQKTIDITPYGYRPRGVKASPDGQSYAVTLESSGTLLILDENFDVSRSVSIGERPYGVGYDSDGKRLLVVAAGAQKLQVFDAQSLASIAEVPVGQRCWHFTFTPDNSKILVACGRSNDLYVIDAESYEPIEVLDGFDLPWGVITYPRAYGSIDLP